MASSSRSSLFHPPLMLLLLLLAISATRPADAFSLIQPFPTSTLTALSSNSRCCSLRATSSDTDAAAADDDDDDADDDDSSSKKKKGDSLRDATGIRPSLNPATINCVAEALLLRSQYVLGKTQNNEGEEIAIDTANTETEPLQIAITAAGIAMSAIDQRSEAAKTDETTDEFAVEESQTISGRVVGVVMRMRDLERLLVRKVNGVGWVRKYGEEESFGVLKKECSSGGSSANMGEEGEAQSSSLLADNDNNDNNAELEKQLADTIKINPLFRMNRAECLLALFLSTVEQPQLERLGQEVAGGSGVDFIDADRLEVLLQE